jgi:Beta-galactosidase
MADSSGTPSTTTGSGNIATSQSFIRIADDRWTFEEAGAGTPFVPTGCNYYITSSGWPPRMWGRFDRQVMRNDFARMQEIGINAIRVWLQWAAFMPEHHRLSTQALDRLAEVLAQARLCGIRVNLTGPEFWEGSPAWLTGEITGGTDHIVRPAYQEAHAEFWQLFAAHIAQEPVVYAFDLANEPFVPWDGPVLRKLWNTWVSEKGWSHRTLKRRWGKFAPEDLRPGNLGPPPNRRIPGSQYLLDYQTFREETACQWLERSAKGIRQVDHHHLVTAGLHQSSCPLEEIIPSRYTGFNPSLLKNCLDYIALHWYPFGNPMTAAIFPYDLPGRAERSLSMFLANCRYCFVGIPVVLEEFSYYGGGSPQFWGGVLPYRTLEEQDLFSRRVIATGRESLGGWLNWPLQDTPESTDTSAFGGFYSAEGKLKPWGRSFRNFCDRLRQKRLRRREPDIVLALGRTPLLTDAQRCERLLLKCVELHREKVMWDFQITDQVPTR